MKKKDFEKKAKGTIVATNLVYQIGCSECVTYRQEPGLSLTTQGLIDGERKEFLTVKKANELVTAHAKDKPLHKPYVLQPIKEYMTHDKNHTIKYREVRGGHIHVYSVDGFEIAENKHAYECLQCGAIYESKDGRNSTLFQTDDPRCLDETHVYHDERSSLSPRLCLCPTIWEQQQELENIEHEKGCVTCHRKAEADKDGFPDIRMYTIYPDVDKPHDKRTDNPAGCYDICGMCYCKETGKHEWMTRTNPKTGRRVNVFCMSCKMKTPHYDKIAKIDHTLRGVKGLWFPKSKSKTKSHRND